MRPALPHLPATPGTDLAAAALALWTATLLLYTPRAAANSTWCWGNGQLGALGDGKGAGNLAYSQALPTEVVGSPSFASVSAGWTHTCALTDAGKAYCWVGEGPQMLGEAGAAANFGRQREAASSSQQQAHEGCCPSHPPSAAQGRGFQGELGTGQANVFNVTPAAVTTDMAWVQVAAGREFSCGVAGGRAYCWVGLLGVP